jgi:hypothetical protein
LFLKIAISRVDLLDAVSLNSSDMEIEDVEITLKNVDDETKSVVINVPEYSLVDNLIDGISLSLKLKSERGVKVGVQKQKNITWLDPNSSIKTISKVYNY